MNAAYKQKFGESPPAAELLNSRFSAAARTSALDDLRELEEPFDIIPKTPSPSPSPRIKVEDWSDKKPVLDNYSFATASSVVNMPPSSSPALKTRATETRSPSMVQYHADDLKAIGRMCGNRLPPASAVQAMFLYEMQRETEQERLFQSQIFRLARAESESAVQGTNMAKLEQQMKALSTRQGSNVMDERLATSKTRLDAHQTKLNEQSTYINHQGEQLDGMQQRLSQLVDDNKKTNELITHHKTELGYHSQSLDAIETKLDTLKLSNASQDATIAEVNTKIQQLEQNDQHAACIFQYQNANIQAAYQNSEDVRASLEASDVVNLRNLSTAQAALNKSFDKLKKSHATLNGDLTQLEDDFIALKSAKGTLSVDVAALKKSNETLQSTVNALNDDIAVLFDERDMLVSHINTATTRIDKLEGLVRALTGQATSPTLAASTTGTGGSNSPQILPVRDNTANGSGKLFDLAVPKGKPLIEYRKASSSTSLENQRPIRAFVPGKQWQGSSDGQGGSAS